MEPYCIGEHRLICADAWSLWGHLEQVDVVISDPPYSPTTHHGARRLGVTPEPLVPFEPLSLDQMILVAQRCCDLARRWVILHCDIRYIQAIANALPHLFVRHGLWIKPNGAPQFSGDRPGMGWEAVAILHRPGRKRWNGGGAHAVWVVPRVSGEAPTEKPVTLVKRWLDDFTQPGDVILDPFMGSGTTGVACVDMGRTFVGIEVDQSQWQRACTRVQHAYGQLELIPRARTRDRVFGRARKKRSEKEQLVLF